MENKFVKISNKEKWQSLLNKVLFKTFFHNLEWEEFLEKNFKWLKFERYLYQQKALLSLARVKVLGKEKLISHPYCEYGGPLPLVGAINGENFQKDFWSEFKNPFRISFHPYLVKHFFSFTNWKLSSFGKNTYFIDNFHQKTADQVWSLFRKTLRHSLNKAKNKRLKIVKCSTKTDLKFFYNIYIQTAKRNKFLPYPFSFFEFFWKSPDAEIILAKYNGRVIAGSCFLFYDKFIHYFLNASNQRFKDLFPNHLILWNQIQKYVGKNFEVFDLGGTGSGASLEIFKSGWGTKKYPIFEFSNFPKGRLGDSNLRKVFGLLPTFLIKKLSPYLLRYKF